MTPRLMTLQEAARSLSEAITADRLRAEAKRGNLQLVKVGGKLFCTAEALDRMIDLCRVSQKDRASICANEPDVKPSGSSSIQERARLAQAAASGTVQALKERLAATSPTSTPRRATVAR